MNSREEGGNVITRKDVRANEGAGEVNLRGKHSKHAVREGIPKYKSEKRNRDVKGTY